MLPSISAPSRRGGKSALVCDTKVKNFAAQKSQDYQDHKLQKTVRPSGSLRFSLPRPQSGQYQIPKHYHRRPHLVRIIVVAGGDRDHQF
jgi:hypothetical protein